MSANASDNKDAAALGVRLQSLTLFLPEVQGAPADNGMSFSPPEHMKRSPALQGFIPASVLADD